MIGKFQVENRITVAQMEKEIEAINLVHVKNIFDPLYVPTHLLSSIHIYIIYTYIYIYR